MRPFVLIALLGIAATSYAVTVPEAYRLIPHRQTPFQAASARMPAAERDYLVAFFHAVDQAIVAKVSARRETTVARAYAPVWNAWDQLKPPPALKAMQDKVKAAILDQQAFLLHVENGQSPWNMTHPKVRSSSANLQSAYADLMRIYPTEIAVNQQAFFDYLCALDFV